MLCLTSAAREKSWLRTVSSKISFNSFSFTRMFAICKNNTYHTSKYNLIIYMYMYKNSLFSNFWKKKFKLSSLEIKTWFFFQVIFFKVCTLHLCINFHFLKIVKFLTLMSFCLRSSSDGPVSTVVIGSLISDTISARTGTRLEEWDFILHRGSMMYLTKLWLTWSMISMSWRRLSTALLKVKLAKQ